MKETTGDKIAPSQADKSAPAAVARQHRSGGDVIEPAGAGRLPSRGGSARGGERVSAGGRPLGKQRAYHDLMTPAAWHHRRTHRGVPLSSSAEAGAEERDYGDEEAEDAATAGVVVTKDVIGVDSDTILKAAAAAAAEAARNQSPILHLSAGTPPMNETPEQKAQRQRDEKKAKAFRDLQQAMAAIEKLKVSHHSPPHIHHKHRPKSRGSTSAGGTKKTKRRNVQIPAATATTTAVPTSAGKRNVSSMKKKSSHDTSAGSAGGKSNKGTAPNNTVEKKSSHDRSVESAGGKSNKGTAPNNTVEKKSSHNWSVESAGGKRSKGTAPNNTVEKKSSHDTSVGSAGGKSNKGTAPNNTVEKKSSHDTSVGSAGGKSNKGTAPNNTVDESKKNPYRHLQVVKKTKSVRFNMDIKERERGWRF